MWILGAREGEQAVDLVAVHAMVAAVPQVHQGHRAGHEQAEHKDEESPSSARITRVWPWFDKNVAPDWV